jgi:hypothetical protein
VKRADLINQAIKLLDAGILPTVLPAALMRQFKTLTPEQARSIAQSALKKVPSGRKIARPD